MGFDHACFISYRHPDPKVDHPLEEEFAEDLRIALDSEFSAHFKLRAFRDDKGLRGGDFIDEAIALALYHSVCLVVVFTRRYFDLEKTYCAREYYAMENLERERLRHLSAGNRSRGLILPIILRSPEHIPEVVTKRKYRDFRECGIYQRELRRDPFGPVIREIANDVVNCYDDFMKCGVEVCPDVPCYKLPDETRVRRWLSQITKGEPGPQLPLRKGRQ